MKSEKINHLNFSYKKSDDELIKKLKDHIKKLGITQNQYFTNLFYKATGQVLIISFNESEKEEFINSEFYKVSSESGYLIEYNAFHKIDKKIFYVEEGRDVSEKNTTFSWEIFKSGLRKTKKVRRTKKTKVEPKRALTIKLLTPKKEWNSVLNNQLDTRRKELGYSSKNEYILNLIRDDLGETSPIIKIMLFAELLNYSFEEFGKDKQKFVLVGDKSRFNKKFNEFTLLKSINEYSEVYLFDSLIIRYLLSGVENIKRIYSKEEFYRKNKFERDYIYIVSEDDYNNYKGQFPNEIEEVYFKYNSNEIKYNYDFDLLKETDLESYLDHLKRKQGGIPTVFKNRNI